MKPNFTEFIVRVYHKRRETAQSWFCEWLRLHLKPKAFVVGRKITVKKHKRLSNKILFNIISDELDVLESSENLDLTIEKENITKAIIKARGKG